MEAAAAARPRRSSARRGFRSALYLLGFASCALLLWLYLQAPSTTAASDHGDAHDAPIVVQKPSRPVHVPPQRSVVRKQTTSLRGRTPEQTTSLRGRTPAPSVPQAAPVDGVLIASRAAAAPRFTIVFDMDETLLHSSPNKQVAEEGPDLFNLKLGSFRASVAVRPHARELLRFVAGRAEMVLWTAGTEDYARGALQRLGGDILPLFHHFIARNPLWFKGDQHTKPLALLGRDKDTTLLIDNNEALVVPGDEANVIVPSDYYRGTADKELRRLQELLDALLSGSSTVPDFLKSTAQRGGGLSWRANRFWLQP
eukprot:TRINITY_DN1967_c0_g1_i1.p2 TRINITY_DN1967_c0_g1~~TRINITY_DN1967_c0_g1_i1.p2  ORF type:complete len:328 (+),score=108.44 TRINITY_DN1967_c0_g1_i1:50-985(+)